MKFRGGRKQKNGDQGGTKRTVEGMVKVGSQKRIWLPFKVVTSDVDISAPEPKENTRSLMLFKILRGATCQYTLPRSATEHAQDFVYEDIGDGHTSPGRLTWV